MDKKQLLDVMGRVIDTEMRGIRLLKQGLCAEFAQAVKLISACPGRIVFTGVGKSGLIAQKITATFSSIGVASFFLSAVEGMHGDMGAVMKDDIVIVLSKSGATVELLNILPFLKRKKIRVISMTACPNSELGKQSDLILKLPDSEEACPFNAAPTTSTTIQLVLGDALAIALLRERGFTAEDFALLHPGGSLGRQFLKVGQIMHRTDELPLAGMDMKMSEVLEVIVKGKLGSALITGPGGVLKGIIVDGDLKRILLANRDKDFLSLTAREVMTPSPRTITPDRLAAEALAEMEGRITSLVVVDGNNVPVGLVHMHDIIRQHGP